MLMVGLYTEAGIFLLLGILGPEKDYYWEKLYPGLDSYNAPVTTLLPDPLTKTNPQLPGLNGEKVESQLGGMLEHLKVRSGIFSSL